MLKNCSPTLDEHTPMIRQYLCIKAKYSDPHIVLFYRMGDFYELFYEDAIRAAAILDISLTHRGQSAGKSVPMAGVPVHAADTYIAKLLRHHYSVALCEQVGTQGSGRNLMERKVVRVFTPGTLSDAEFLDQNQDNLLLSLYLQSSFFGIALLDMSSGRFHLLEGDGEEALRSELARLRPAELLVEEGVQSSILDPYQLIIRKKPSSTFAYHQAINLISQQMQTKHLHLFGCLELKLALRAAGCLLHYARSMQQAALAHIRKITVEYRSDSVILDAATRRNLELDVNLSGGQDRTLFAILHSTQTAMGSRLLKRWVHRPIRDHAELKLRHQGVASLYQQQTACSVLQQHLKTVADLERITARIALKTARPRDLAQLRYTLQQLPLIREQLAVVNTPKLNALHESIQTFSDLYTLLQRAIVEHPPVFIRDGGVIASQYDPDLDELRAISTTAGHYLLQLEEREKKHTGLSTLKVGYNRVHGYYIEISRVQAKLVPSHYIRRQTLKNTERFIIEELKTFEEKVLSSREKALSHEKMLYESLLEQLWPTVPALQACAQALATVDVLANFAHCARQYHWSSPQFTTENKVHIQSGRHPVVEPLSDQPFIPNDVYLDTTRRLLMITGPNMGGKSTYMRQTALIILLAHIGSFVPAESAILGPIDRIFTRIGSTDDLASGRSTFMVEMSEMASILHHATKNSVVLVDEIGRGTSTFDGLSLAWACAKYLAQQIQALSLFATHYFELTTLAEIIPQIDNIHLSAVTQDQKIIFLHTVCAGAATQSYGIQVATLAGIPDSVIANAKRLLSSLEQRVNTDHQSKKTVLIEQTVSSLVPSRESAHHPIMGFLDTIHLDQLTAQQALHCLHQLKKQAAALRSPSAPNNDQEATEEVSIDNQSECELND